MEQDIKNLLEKAIESAEPEYEDVAKDIKTIINRHFNPGAGLRYSSESLDWVDNLKTKLDDAIMNQAEKSALENNRVRITKKDMQNAARIIVGNQCSYWTE